MTMIDMLLLTPYKLRFIVLNLHLMRIFYTLVQEGSFSGAATVLH